MRFTCEAVRFEEEAVVARAHVPSVLGHVTRLTARAPLQARVGHGTVARVDVELLTRPTLTAVPIRHIVAPRTVTRVRITRLL